MKLKNVEAILLENSIKYRAVCLGCNYTSRWTNTIEGAEAAADLHEIKKGHETDIEYKQTQNFRIKRKNS